MCLENYVGSNHKHGPMQEYDARVEGGRLRDDEHQRGMLAWRNAVLESDAKYPSFVQP